VSHETPQSDEKVAEELQSRQALGYRPSRLVGYYDGDVQPLWRYYHDVEMMLTHPWVRIGLNIFSSAIWTAKFEVESPDPRVKAFAEKQLEAFWSSPLRATQQGYPFGWLGGELVYKEENGVLGLDALDPFSPRDTQVLVQGRKRVGVRVQGVDGGTVDLWGPGQRRPAKAWWFVHRPRFDRFYGTPQCYGAWRPWRRLAGRDGAEEVIDGGFYRFAYGGYVVRYPAGGERTNPANRSPVSGEFSSNRDAAREMAEQLKAGGSMALSSARDQHGNYAWDVQHFQTALQLGPLLEYASSLEKAILIGMDVLPEILQASDTGSGYSGRQVPKEAFFLSRQADAEDTVQQWRTQIGLPLARFNYGPRATFTVKVLPLLAAQEQAAQGVSPAAPAPAGRPGRGQRDPNTGRIYYGLSAGKPRATVYLGPGDHKFACALCPLPDDAARRVLALGRMIADEDLADEGRESEPHVTALYGLHDDDPQAVADVLAKFGPLDVTLGRVSVFPASDAGGADVVKLDVKGDDLHRLHDALKGLPHTLTHPDYQPHVTLAYVKPGRGARYAGNDALAGLRVRLGDVEFSDRCGRATTLPLVPRDGRVQLATDPPRAPAEPTAEAILHAAAGALGRIDRRAARELQRAIRRAGPADAERLAKQVFAKHRRRLERLLGDAHLAAALAAMGRTADGVRSGVSPTAPAPFASPPLAGLPPVPPDAGTVAAGVPGDPPPEIAFPQIQAAVKVLADKQILTRDDYDQLRSAARQDAYTVAGLAEERAVKAVRDAAADAVLKGGTLSEFRARLEEALGDEMLSPARTEQVFRDSVMGAYSAGLERVLAHPVVREGFPYARYDATHDARTRPEHLALERMGLDGTNVFRIDDPVFIKFRPPWEWGCRCIWTPISVESAAALGVREAQRWLETGEPPATPQYVNMPPFEPPAEFVRLSAMSNLTAAVRLSSLTNATALATEHAPEGGANIGGKDYAGGQFTPNQGGTPKGDKATARKAKRQERRERRQEARTKAAATLRRQIEAKRDEHGEHALRGTVTATLPYVEAAASARTAKEAVAALKAGLKAAPDAARRAVEEQAGRAILPVRESLADLPPKAARAVGRVLDRALKKMGRLSADYTRLRLKDAIESAKSGDRRAMVNDLSDSGQGFHADALDFVGDALGVQWADSRKPESRDYSDQILEALDDAGWPFDPESLVRYDEGVDRLAARVKKIIGREPPTPIPNYLNSQGYPGDHSPEADYVDQLGDEVVYPAKVAKATELYAAVIDALGLTPARRAMAEEFAAANERRRQGGGG
jgi:2'-5' RNA ligase